jgi:arylsulfatase A-like enzyme
VGKWHLHANVPAKRLNPNRMGYDYYSGNFNGAISDYFSYPIIVNGIVDTANEYATTQTINDAISWLDTISNTKPFFLWLGFNAPHSPYHLPPADLCDTTGLTGTAAHINNNKSKYFKAALQALDSEIGRLFAYLETNGMLDSTNIIFIGDNGNASEVAQNISPTRCKGTIYQYGVQVPVIVSGPAVVNPNRNCTELINTPDLFATMAELAGMSNWSSFIPTSNKLDSRSLLPYIKNQNQPIRTWIFTEQFQDTTNAKDGKTIRDSEYQLLRFDNGNEEFYHVLSDPQQMTNLLTGSMSVTDISHYHSLCDTLNTLLGSGSCSPVQTLDWSVNSLTLFPNPFNESVCIQSSKSIKQWTIIDMQGRPVLEGKKNEIETEHLPKGIYLLQVILTDGRIQILKCTKE